MKRSIILLVACSFVVSSLLVAGCDDGPGETIADMAVQEHDLTPADKIKCKCSPGPFNDTEEECLEDQSLDAEKAHQLHSCIVEKVSEVNDVAGAPPEDIIEAIECEENARTRNAQCVEDVKAEYGDDICEHYGEVNDEIRDCREESGLTDCDTPNLNEWDRGLQPKVRGCFQDLEQ